MDEQLEKMLGRLHEPLNRKHAQQREELLAAIVGRAPEKAHRARRPIALVAAAAVFVGIAVAVVWRVAIKRTSSSPVPVDVEVSFAQFKQDVEEAGFAAQLLAAADIFARQPEGRKYAIERYQHIVATYPGTTAAQTARERLAAGRTGGQTNEG